ncbi:MAG: type III-A CRISPR-associated RAMP protein Csm3 [Nanopusillaceae archaeon]
MTSATSSEKFIYGYIRLNLGILTLTGLKIGGNKENVEIGAIDNPVIKDPVTGYPYIPGSSLKGKLRSIVEKLNNMVKNNGEPYGIKKEEMPGESGKSDIDVLKKLASEDQYFIIRVFGNHKHDIGLEPRLVFRDLLYNGNEIDLSRIYEIKTENVVDRIKGSAQHPRENERVRKGIEFKGEVIYKLTGWSFLDENTVRNQAKKELGELFKALKYLVKYDYLGGSGTRGYGKVAIFVDSIEVTLNNNQTIYIDLKSNINQSNTNDELIKHIVDLAKELNNTSNVEAQNYGVSRK